MPNVEKDQAENMEITRTRGVWRVTLAYFVTDLTAANAPDLLAQALYLYAGGDAHTGDNIPKDGEELIIRAGAGQVKVYAREFRLGTWANVNCTVIVVFTQDEPSQPTGFSPTQREVGGSVEMVESSFDAANMDLPYPSRKTIQVAFDGTLSGAPGPNAEWQAARVPMWVGKSHKCFDRETSVNPEGMSELMLGGVNSTSWEGHAAGTCMVVVYTGRNVGDGIWHEHIEIARDDTGKFKQYARFVDRQTGRPVSLGTNDSEVAANVAGENGIREVTVQPGRDFNLMSL